MERVFLLLILCTSTLFADNWPSFRGADGSATTKLPLKISKSNLKWSFDLKGGGSSSPVVWGNKLFITAANSGKLRLICVNTETGKEDWSKALTTGEYHTHRFNNQAASSPLLTQSHVFITWFDGQKNKGMLGAFTHDGKEAWTKVIGDFKGRHGFTLNPSTHDGKVIVAHLHQGDSYVTLLNNKDGSEVWKVSFPPADVSYSKPLIRKNGSKYEVILTGPSIGMVSLDFNSGKQNWQLRNAHKLRTVASPVEVTIDGETYLSSSTKTYAYTAAKISGKPEVTWTAKKMGSYVPTHLAWKSSVFVLKDSGTLTEYNLKENKKVKQTDLKDNFYASPLLINNHIYCLSRNAKLSIVNPEDMSIVHKLDLNAPESAEWTDSTPAVANDSLYIRLGNRLDCYK